MTDYPANVPARLIAAIQEAGSARKFAKQQGINILYVSQLLRDGIEPTDKTEKGRDVRVKLFLPRRKRKPRVTKPEEFVGQKRIRRKIAKLAKDTREKVLMVKK
jgi:hypothetical protein